MQVRQKKKIMEEKRRKIKEERKVGRNLEISEGSTIEIRNIWERRKKKENEDNEWEWVRKRDR